MSKFICLREVVDGKHPDEVSKSLLLNVNEIASCDKPNDPTGYTRVTMRDGREYIVDESVNTIQARITYD
jgi:uncharacterized protein YlzI (FlbEa/FlbD family)